MEERVQNLLNAGRELIRGREKILRRAGLVLFLYVSLYLVHRALPPAVQVYTGPAFYPLVSLFGPETAETDKTGRLKVRVLTIAEGQLTPAIVSTGTIEPFEKVEIFAKTPGRIERFFVDQGQAVKAGDVLVQMERLPLEIQLREQRARYTAAHSEFRQADVRYRTARREIEGRWKQIERLETSARLARAQLDRTRKTYKGQQLLYREGGLSPEQFRAGRTELMAREAEFLQAKKDLEIAQIGFRDGDIKKRGRKVPADPDDKRVVFTDINTEDQRAARDVARDRAAAERSAMEDTQRLLGETTIRAPVDGVVAARSRSAGEEISGLGSATGSGALLTIVSIDRVYAVVSVLDKDTRKLKIGQKFKFTVDVFPDTKYVAEVKLKSPTVDRDTGTITVKAILENPNDELLPGMSLEGEIVTGEDRPALLVPVSALQQPEEDETTAWRVQEGRAYPVRVRTGERRGENIEIREGLNAGDVIVIEKLALMREGLKVKPIETAAPGAGE